MKTIHYSHQSISKDDIKAVIDVLKSECLTTGPVISQFERSLCDYSGAKYAVACSSGTAALHLACLALNLDEGSEGITSTNSFLASANCMEYCGIKVRFSDVEYSNLSVSLQTIAKVYNKRTKLLIPVHFAGFPVEMKKIKKFAEEKKLFIIEDAAHALGTQYRCSAKVGCCKYSDMTTFSFHPLKAITTGEGGAITTNNKKLYEKLLQLRNHGIEKKNNKGPWFYEMKELGFNYRMTDIQAALGISQMRKLDKFIQKRKRIAKLYDKAFSNLDWLDIAFQDDKELSSYHLYVLLINYKKIRKSRSQVMNELLEKNIRTQVHYIPIHTQPYYKNIKNDTLPNSENYYKKSLSIPLYPGLKIDEVTHIIDSIIELNKRN